MWRTFSTQYGGCFPLHGDPGTARPGTHPPGWREDPPGRPSVTGWVLVPELVGTSSQDARRIARLAKLGLLFEDQAVDPGLRGRVLRQKPEPGAQVRPGDVVEVWIGARRGVVVPDVYGADEQDALVSLRSAGLSPARRCIRRSNSVGQGLVIRTRPRAGKEVPVGTRITYVVASAPRVRAPVRRQGKRDRVRRMPEGSFLSMPERE